MSTVKRIVLGIAGLLLVVLLVIFIMGYRLLHRSLPDYTEPVDLGILEQPVEIVWDDYAVPHIYARNARDLFRAAGYVCAQERLWQMEFSRRIARGTLSEIFGDATLEQDKLFRVLGFYRTARKLANFISDESREALEAFAEGVNAYIERHSDRLPLEFSLLGFKPEPWRIEDSIAFLRVMGFQLSYAWNVELLFSRLAEQFGLQMVTQLFPDYEADSPTILSELPGQMNMLLARLEDTFRRAGFLIRQTGAVPGSNSWVVSGEKSRSGKPILANDPHLGLTLPPVWFEMHLNGGGYNVYGVALPLSPTIIIGQNEAIAWGFTNGMVDDADFYLEKFHPENKSLYLDGNEWKTCEVVQEKIVVKGKDDPVFFDVRLTRRGPVVSDIFPDLVVDSLGVAFRWTGYEMSDELLSFLKLNRASNWDDFVDAVSHFKVPCQNIIFADTSGTIGYYAAGSVPMRRDGKGYLVYRGWENRGDWVGMIPFDEMPHQKNPPAGYIATANNKMAPNFPYYLGHAWEPDSRIRRIVELLEEKEKLSVEDFMRIQNDSVSAHARKVFPVLLQIVKKQQSDDRAARLIAFLEEWDFSETPTNAAAAFYNVWFVKLAESTLKDEMGDSLYKRFTHWSNFLIRSMERLIHTPDSKWWDNVETPGTETRDQVVLRTFEETVQELTEQLGEGPGFWEWGRLHRLTLRHVLGQKAPLSTIFNRGPFPIAGSPNTIPKAEFSFTEPYSVTVGASMRQIVDLAQPRTAYRVLPGGQSGQPFSDHYDDQIPLWLTGQYRKTTLERPPSDRVQRLTAGLPQ